MVNESLPGTATELASQVLQQVKQVLKFGHFPKGLHEPVFMGHEAEYLQECLTTTLVSSVGPFVDRFERRLEDYTGAARAVAVVNGTSALHLGLRLLGVGTDDEVLIPALTFVATANAVRYCGAWPHFVEANAATLGIDPVALEIYLRNSTRRASDGSLRNAITGRRIAACVPMHTFGLATEMEPLLTLCAQYQIPLLEDAAEAMGSFSQGKHLGTFAPVGVLSFNGNKIITTGGGGALLFQDRKLGDKAKHLSSTAKVTHPWKFIHDEVGYNYRMPNLNAALGVAQLENIDFYLAQKKQLYENYARVTAELPHVQLVGDPPGCRSNHWLITLRFEEQFMGSRDVLLNLADGEKIPMRPPWELIPELAMYRDCPSMDLPMAKQLAASLVNLPSGAGIMPAARLEKS